MSFIPKWVLWGAAAGLVSLGILAAGPGISQAGGDYRFSAAVQPGTAQSFTDLSVDNLIFNGGGTPCLTRGGATAVQTCTGDSFISTASIQSQMDVEVWGRLKNLNTGANCPSNTGAVCVDDVNGFAVADGAGTATVATISNAGALVVASANLGSTVTGSWNADMTGLVTATTNYGAFQISQSITNVKFRQVSCTHRVAGTSTAGTLAVRNVTDGTTLCSGSYTCTTAANTPTAIFDCNQTPLASKMYAIQFSTGCGGTQVTDLNCSVEIAH